MNMIGKLGNWNNGLHHLRRISFQVIQMQPLKITSDDIARQIFARDFGGGLQIGFIEILTARFLFADQLATPKYIDETL
ncbi:hypothetical protein NGM44_10555 [Moraxella sp. FZFQ2102]|nr:hypothetical protein [Moraxella sp. FZFQ2102]USZ14772.1 hypothetical protein NGM44_10555 [Moraxella sp. FZFQ2102]